MIDSKDIELSRLTFRGLGLAPKLIELLDAGKLVTPTPIQSRAIPSAVAGQDVVGVAQTGTGKTLAYGLPTFQRMLNGSGAALILVPTRELAAQVGETLGKYGRPLGIPGVVLVGGTSIGRQIADLRRNPRVIIATPGRLLDLIEQRAISLKQISILILDEADRMLDMGFWPQIQRIITAVPKDRQTMLFSATLSNEIMDLARSHMRTPTSIEVAPSGTTAEKVIQEFFIVHRNDKVRLLESVLGTYTGSAIIFTRTKHGAKRLALILRNMGHRAAEIHANRSFSQRKDALEGFKTGRHRILVATDIASRGIDVKGIELVINYDIPTATEDYVHRIGRTARAGSEGRAISFATPEERHSMRAIERLIRQPLKVSATPALPPARALPPVSRDSGRPHRGGRPHNRPYTGGRSSGHTPYRGGPSRPRR